VLNTAYISRLFPLGPADAIDATEAWRCDLAPAAGRGRLVAAHRLRLRQCFEATGCDPLLLRRLRGTLWVGWWPVAVELELVSYSRDASEIAVRPSSTRWPVLTERYEKDATRAVEEVVSAIKIAAKSRVKQRRKRQDEARGRQRRLVTGPSSLNHYLAEG
jgi:hypothetical protein